MRRAVPVGLTAVALLFLAPVFAAVQSPTAPASAADRLVHVAKLWGMIRYLHPYLMYREIDWDAALVSAIPRVREAKTTDAYQAAVQGMLDALGDPVTRVEAAPPSHVEASTPAQPAAISRKIGNDVLLIELTRYLKAFGPQAVPGTLGQLRGEIGNASTVLIDLRAGKVEGAEAFYSNYLLGQIADLLVSRPSRAPAQRYVLYQGYPPQTGGSSGGYHSGFVTEAGTIYQPPASATRKKVIFLLDPWTNISPLVPALQAAGDARIVAEGLLREDFLVSRQAMDLGEGLTAQVRLSETVPFPGWTGLRADVRVQEGSGDAALEAAVAEARTGWPALIGVSNVNPLPDPIFRPDRAYEQMLGPDLEHRQLAVIRAWNAIYYFYPYLHLIGDWDAILPEFLDQMEQVATFRDYALTLLEMMAHVADGHTGLWGRLEVGRPFGEAGLPIHVRWTEGYAVIWQVSEEVQAAGLEVGDAILEIDGETVEARTERMSRYTAASTRPALLNRIAAQFLLAGDPDSTADLKILKLDGSIREVNLPRVLNPALLPEHRGDVVRILPGNLGYVDLTRLTLPEVDSMFEKLENTRGIIFDMRGYPQGTAWAIAPRINTSNAKIGAQFRRRQVSPFSMEPESGFFFAQPLPDLPEGKVKYTGPTVMLIDDRAISQSEHSGLFFEAANGTKFIGTATAGANGDVTRFPVPGGIWISFTGHDVRHADGLQLQRMGLIPDVEVAPTRAGLQGGRDEVLDRAVSYLDELLSSR